MTIFTPSSFLLAYILDATVIVLILCLVCFYPRPPLAPESQEFHGVLWPLLKKIFGLHNARPLSFPIFSTRIVVQDAALAWLIGVLLRHAFVYTSSLFGFASPAMSTPSNNRLETYNTSQAVAGNFISNCTVSSTPTLLLFFFGGIVIVLLYLLIDERCRFGSFIKWRDGAPLDVNFTTAEERDSNDPSKTLEAIKTALKCPICTELLTQPYTLDPCGHTFDLVCLQQWFRTAPPVDEDTDTPPQWLCPICRSVVYLPSPCYSLKSVVAALKPGNGGGPLANEDEPWADFFFEDLDL
ncbi:hypothetical protein B0H13DRAFT_2047179, partial [Mycena leptocephala]